MTSERDKFDHWFESKGIAFAQDLFVPRLELGNVRDFAWKVWRDAPDSDEDWNEDRKRGDW